MDPNAQPNIVIDDGPLTFVKTISGYDFKPVVSGAGYNYGAYGGIYWTGSGDPYFFHNLELPQGVKVIDITFYFYDNDAVNDVFFTLTTLNVGNHTLTHPV